MHSTLKLTNGPNKLDCLCVATLSSLVQYNTSLLGQIVSYEENEVLCEYVPWYDKALGKTANRGSDVVSLI